MALEAEWTASSEDAGLDERPKGVGLWSGC